MHSLALKQKSPSTAARSMSGDIKKREKPVKEQTAVSSRCDNEPAILQAHPVFTRGLLQPKLMIGASDDPLEREADRVAEHVMGMSRTETRSTVGIGFAPAAVQLRANGAHSGATIAPPIVQEVLDSPGRPLDAATRAFMEPRFGHDFSQVRVHGDAKAAESANAIGAIAYTAGRHIVFSRGCPTPSTADGNRLLGHELAHTIQQNVNGSVAGGIVQRAVTTNGGSFDTDLYTPINAPTGSVGEWVGAQIKLDFTANDLVESTKIGMIQSVKAMKSTPTDPARTKVNTAAGPEEGQLIMKAGQIDPGREIDRVLHPDGRPLPNTSPIYGVHNSPGHVAANLTDGTPTSLTSHWGFRTKDPVTHLVSLQTARIHDKPHRTLEFEGQTYEHTFESTAIALEGPIPVNTYLGSVTWGWRCDAAGDVTLAPLTVAHAGAPSAAFMGAATRWNAAVFHETGTRKTAASVDVPITTLESGTVAAADRSTVSLLNQISSVDFEIAGLAAGNDLTNKRFELRALEAELKQRNVKVSVHVISTEDFTGADDVYVKLAGPGGGSVYSPVQKLNDGDSHDFLLPVSKLLPLTGTVQVKVYEQDWLDADDLIVDTNFAAPWTAAHSVASVDTANYDVKTSFER